ncbi:LacI family DNA-binding transcriptional regulator [Peteryoungia desertarenae]|uniref:LacI family DNA-binding transcriptional regulator n=1 Tax=Peteryoungia desertarenae TaxID=1813451 RepID=A0ABX6QNB4_9HYPH|nr:LacI family DNA-binding transcriptional regulator [Peteryoungia desertarenae]QLF69720.1 LacI family DNA-binding transcriptional regulator [Peteryoungia desertarenae]
MSAGKRQRNRHQRVTLSDVAQAAGVSSITVSRTLREPDKVSPDLRETVLKFVDSMGYIPDFAARALASSDSGIIGVISPALTNHAYLGVMRGIEDRVRSTDLRIQYANTTYDPADEVRQLKQFLAQNPTGIIFANVDTNPAVEDMLRVARCPVVQIMDVSKAPANMAIGIDHKVAGEMATRHLIESGYRRIGLLGGRWDARARRRLEGYTAVMKEAGLYDPALIIALDHMTSVPLGGHLLDRLLQTVPDADAAFCHHDELALGAVFECQRRGIDIPSQFGICGYNDMDYVAVSVPAITSVRIPRYEIGFRAVDMILRALDRGSASPSLVDLGFTLVRRASTARQG